MVRFETKSTFKRLGTLMLALSLAVSSTGFTSLANYSVENENVGGSSGELLEENVLTKIENDANYLKMDYSLMTDYAKAEAEINVESVYNEIATFSNATNIIAVVETEDELKNAIAVAGEGDIIEIANDIYLSETIHIDSSITLKALPSVGDIVLYSGYGFRHFYVEGDMVLFKTENIILDGQNNGGGIFGYANHLIMSDMKLYNCLSDNGGAVYAIGELTIFESKLFSNTATIEGGAVYAAGNLTIIASELYQNNSDFAGGAIFAQADIIIRKCYIKENKAAEGGGGGVFTLKNLIVTDSLFMDNISVNASGGGLCAATYVDSDFANITISGCDFIDNKSPKAGGGGLYLCGKTFNYIIDSSFVDNSSGPGGGGLSISDWCSSTYISGCDIFDNYANDEFALGGGIGSSFGEDNVIVIENSRICGNFSNGSGGGIGLADSYQSLSEALLVISNCEITNNISMKDNSVIGSGGGIYVNPQSLKLLEICNNSMIKDNFAINAFKVTNVNDIILHNQQIHSTTTWTEGFDYIYNNLDVSYPLGNLIDSNYVEIEEYFEDTVEKNTYKYNIVEGFQFHYEFTVYEGYQTLIESNAELQINMEVGTIDIESVMHDTKIQITYKPIEKEDEHTVTIITHYLDGVHMDESKSYLVQKGTSFLEHYDVLEGYKFAGMNIRSSYPEIDINNQTIYIDSVEEDYIITINLSRKKLNVQITTQYMDGVLPDETKSYQVLYGDTFAESYDALEGYVFAGMSIRSYPYVDISNGMVCIDEVTEDYHIVVKLRRAEYKVKITVEYEGSDLENQVSTYTVLHGDSFKKQFDIADGYNIAIIKAEKGVDLDYFMQIVEIENVTKDVNITIVCR